MANSESHRGSSCWCQSLVFIQFFFTHSVDLNEHLAAKTAAAVTVRCDATSYRRAETRRGGRDEGFRNLILSLARARQRDGAADCSDSLKGFTTTVVNEELAEIFKPCLVLPSLRFVVFQIRRLGNVETHMYTRKDDNKTAFQVGFAFIPITWT